MIKSTSTMTLEELARVWAEHNGLEGRTGGWIYADGKPIVQGYVALGRALAKRGVLKVGVGIDWRRADQYGLTRLLLNIAKTRRIEGASR